MLIGSYDSTRCKGKHSSSCLCWESATQDMTLTEQYQLGIRFFDLRYKLNDIYYINHTNGSTLERAFADLIQCSIDSNEYVFIRLKREESSYPLPSFGYTLDSMMIRGTPLHEYVIQNHGRKDIRIYLKRTPISNRRLIIYSDDTTLSEDNVLQSWFFPQIFDVIETMDCERVEDAIQIIHDKPFKNNGLPRAIFLTFHGTYHSEMAFELLWDHVQHAIRRYSRNGEIECIMISYVCATMIRAIRS